MNTNNAHKPSKHIYWMTSQEFKQSKSIIKANGYSLSAVLKTPCESLKASGKKILYVSPVIFRTICKRQGSWYLQSEKAGKTMLVSDGRLPEYFDRFLDAQLSESNFQPTSLPEKQDLQTLVDSVEYQSQRPDEWENPGIKDSVMFKILFTVNGFWGIGDNLKSHWLNHCSNHANFLTERFTTDVDGQAVPYSVTNNDGVCSSCVEFFNLVTPNSRKYVRACPGSITFAGVKRDMYYDLIPENKHTITTSGKHQNI